MLLTQLTLTLAPLFADVSTMIAQLTGDTILDIALVLFVLAILAALANQQQIANITMQVVKWVFILFIVVFILSFIF